MSPWIMLLSLCMRTNCLTQNYEIVAHHFGPVRRCICRDSHPPCGAGFRPADEHELHSLSYRISTAERFWTPVQIERIHDERGADQSPADRGHAAALFYPHAKKPDRRCRPRVQG